MPNQYVSKLIKSAFIFTIFFCFISISVTAQESTYTLDNGMTVILKESHSSPMITSMVFVKSGSKYESEFENGITHFLEHLLFDGTTHKSREDIDGSIRDLGGYINAFTRKDMTGYLVLLPKQYIDYGMTVQADMLFNSTIPQEELPKERKVVIEEINRDKDSPGYAAENFRTAMALGNTEYSRPVLGYKSFIENISRDAIVNYYKKFYVPSKMTLLVIGDFESDEMKKTIESVFGISTKLTPNINQIIKKVDFKNEGVNLEVGMRNDIVSQILYDTVANVQSTYIDFSIKAPLYSDSDYIPLDLLCMYYSMNDISPLMKALKSGADPLATEASIGINMYENFSKINISVVTDKPENKDAILAVIKDFFNTVSSHQADAETLEGIKTSVKTENIYLAEKLHYLGFMMGPTMMTAGYDFVKTYPEKLTQTTWKQAQTAAEKYLSHPSYIATVVRPVKENEQPYIPYEMSEETIKSYFDTAAFKFYNLDSGIALTYPPTDSVSFELVDKSTYHSEKFDNGMTLIIKSNPSSRVFALNVIGKNRTVNEPMDKAGITDFVNRMVENGTATRNASELSRDLAKIGANVTLYDNPWIPYDDRYTSRSFSFMKFETIDDFAKKGFNLFADMILLPSFDSSEVENVRNAMIGILGRNAVSSKEIAKDLFYQASCTPDYAKPIMGTVETISSITVADLQEYHDKFYAPDNIILSIVTNKSIDEIRSWVYQRFGRLAPLNIEYATPQRPEPNFETKVMHHELDKEQIQIYIGSTLPGANSPDAHAISIASSILSTRLYLNLREKQGLAYSVGAGSQFENDFGLFYAVIGTKSENYQQAVDGILLEIDKLKFDGPTADELQKAKNEIWGRLMSAKLSSINQAYYLGLDDFYHRKVGYDKIYLNELAKISIEDIRRVASTYFKTDGYILASAGKKL